MKKTYSFRPGNKKIECSVFYIPIRFIVAIIIMSFEVAAVFSIMVALCYYVPYFYIAAWLTEIFCVLSIISSDNNPEYKVPWLLVVLLIPIAGFMLYFMFYSRKLPKKLTKRLKLLRGEDYLFDDAGAFSSLESEDKHAAVQARQLTKISGSRLFDGGKVEYFPLGEDKHKRLLEDLESAEKFIFMEYFTIEEGVFGNSILDILKKKVKSGVEVRVIYDDVGCIESLPGNYYHTLRSLVHHFECGVWMYKTEIVSDIRRDIDATLKKCIEICEEDINISLPRQLLRKILRVFATLL